MKSKFFYLLFVSLFCLCSEGIAQTKEIRGVVTDESEVPIIGANVRIQGNKTTGTITDFEGRFSLRASADDVLEFSYIGYSTISEKVAGRDVINVVLSEDSKTLDEVVVVGYGSMSKKNLTTAISKVSTDKISKSAISNASQMLLGQAAGMQATVSSSQPGGGINISIRGGGTPVYVIDGVVSEPSALESSGGVFNNVNRAGLAGLNPEDIESIEVLKDASAAIYGLGASNGVILITTKKGKTGKMKLSYDGSMSLVQNFDYLEPLGAKDYMNYANLYSKELYLYNNKMGVYGPNDYDGKNVDKYSPEQIANARDITNWLDLVMRNGSISNHKITLQGGSDKISYYLSGSYFRQTGSVSKSDMSRYILRSVVNAQIFKFLKLSNTLNFNSNEYHNGAYGSAAGGGIIYGALAAAVSFPTFLPVRDENGAYSRIERDPLATNPMESEEISDFSQSQGFSTNFTFDIDIWKKYLTAKLVYGYTREYSKRDVFVPDNILFGGVYQSRGNMAKDARTAQTMEAILNFTKSVFDDKLNVDVMAGMGLYLTDWDGVGLHYTDINNVIGNDNIGAATGAFNDTSYRGAAEKRSQFIRANIDFLDRYALSAALRRDGTDKFFPNRKYGLFPSVSIAWKIFNEEFMKDISWIDMFKIRASFGVTGSDNLGSTLYGNYGPSGSPVYFENKYIPYVLSHLDYPNVTWEKNTMKDIGIDFSILNDRISGSFDYYWNDITDMLGYASSEGLSMFSSYPINGGHIRKQGWDLSVNTKNLISKNFSWNTKLTLSSNKGFWVKQFPNYDYKPYEIQKNTPLAVRYYYEMDGIVNSDLSNVPESQPDEFRVPGFPIVKDQNGDNVIDKQDIVADDNRVKLYWGMGNYFTWKNWDLDIFLYSQLGIHKYNYTYDWCDPNGIGEAKSNQSKEISKVWNSINNPNGTLPGVAYRLSSVSLPEGVGLNIGDENASFVRVRNITLGYNFTSKELKRFNKYISNIRLYVDIQNPFVFTSFGGLDPEIITGGSYRGGKGEYPQTRTYSFGLKLTL